jgi:hypothetical protein
VTPTPPPSPAYGWQRPTPAPRPRLLGIARWVWLVAWLPLLPTALMALAAPAFERPIFEVPLAILCLALLPLANLGVGRASRNDTVPAVAIGLTTVVGFLFPLFGPAIIAVWQAQ